MKKENYNVAIVGATGAVGEQMREVLEERQFPVGELRLLASERSVGQFLPFQSRQLPVEVSKKIRLKISTSDYSLPAVASAPSSRHWRWRPARWWSTTLRCFAWSRTFRWWFPKSIPKRLPNTKPAASSPIRIARRSKWSSRSSRFMTRRGIKRVVVSTYQSVSGAGRKAMEELSQQVAALFNGKEIEKEQVSASDRLQLYSAYRCLHGRRLHQGRVEDDQGDAQDSRRAEPAGDRDHGAGAGVLQPLGIGQRRDQSQVIGQRGPAIFCVKRPASSSRTSRKIIFIRWHRRHR